MIFTSPGQCIDWIVTIKSKYPRTACSIHCQNNLNSFTSSLRRGPFVRVLALDILRPAMYRGSPGVWPRVTPVDAVLQSSQARPMRPFPGRCSFCECSLCYSLIYILPVPFPTMRAFPSGQLAVSAGCPFTYIFSSFSVTIIQYVGERRY